MRESVNFGKNHAYSVKLGSCGSARYTEHNRATCVTIILILMVELDTFVLQGGDT